MRARLARYVFRSSAVLSVLALLVIAGIATSPGQRLLLRSASQLASGPATRVSAAAATVASGMPHPHIAVAGSMMCSGRDTTHQHAITITSRRIAPRPAHPASLRSSQALGLIAEAKLDPLNSAANATR